jgi:hypothetical protein
MGMIRSDYRVVGRDIYDLYVTKSFPAAGMTMSVHDCHCCNKCSASIYILDRFTASYIIEQKGVSW